MRKTHSLVDNIPSLDKSRNYLLKSRYIHVLHTKVYMHASPTQRDSIPTSLCDGNEVKRRGFGGRNDGYAEQWFHQGLVSSPEKGGREGGRKGGEEAKRMNQHMDVHDCITQTLWQLQANKS